MNIKKPNPLMRIRLEKLRIKKLDLLKQIQAELLICQSVFSSSFLDCTMISSFSGSKST